MVVVRHIRRNIPDRTVFSEFAEGVLNPWIVIEALRVDWKGCIRGQRFPEGRATGSAERADVSIGRAGFDRLDMVFAFEQPELFPFDEYDRR
ncbi:hypothetical protein A8B78_16910 [Jannaschia sp. EhC01]|nr:hypothetical protein A8B78_16910 [Jannaschia sp. EhC01]